MYWYAMKSGGLLLNMWFVIYFFVLEVETYFLPAQHKLNMLWTCETMNRINLVA